MKQNLFPCLMLNNVPNLIGHLDHLKANNTFSKKYAET